MPGLTSGYMVMEGTPLTGDVNSLTTEIVSDWRLGAKPDFPLTGGVKPLTGGFSGTFS